MVPLHTILFVFIVLSELNLIFGYHQTSSVEIAVNSNAKESKILKNLISSIPTGAAFSATSSIIDTVRSIPRKLKTLTSSAVEAIILEMTMPLSNTFIEESDIKRLLKLIETICSDYNNNVDGKSCKLDGKKFNLLTANSVQEEICYDLIIRKLSSKLKEKDWRIGGKSLHIIHQLIGGNSKDTVKNKQYFCSSYLEKFNLISDNIESHIPMQKDNLKVPVAEKLDIRCLQHKWMKAYTVYLQTFSELVCREGGSYMSDLMVMKGPVPALQLYSRYFAAAQTLMEDTIALGQPNKCSFTDTISTASIDLVTTDVMYSMSQLQKHMSEKSARNSYHIGSFIEMQHVSADLRSSLTKIASLTRNVKLFTIPAWLNDLTSMESSAQSIDREMHRQS